MGSFAPNLIGLPEQFTDWRKHQLDAVNWMLDCKERFVCLCAPTGFGKSLAYMAAGYLSGKRTVVLTSTKGLQDQIQRDFSSIAKDIRGMQNYPCIEAENFDLPHYTKVNDGPCHAGAKCDKRTSGCLYFDAYRVAQRSNLVVTNYQCWMYDRQKEKQLLSDTHPVKLLILDECHDALLQLSDYLAVEIERKECLALNVGWPQSGYSQLQWQDWAGFWHSRLEERIESAKQQMRMQGTSWPRLREIRTLRELDRKLEQVAGMLGQWVIEEQEQHADTMRSVRFDPLWPKEYAQGALFRGVDKVVLVSATVRHKTAALLGIKPEEMAFREFPSTFPVENRPVWHVPTVRMNHRTEADDDKMVTFLRKLDMLLDKRADRKGLVHSVSYRRARFILDNSRHAGRMMIHGSDTRSSVIDSFRQADPASGAILVSPSVDTGYDFHGTLAEYQIICKLPFPDTRGTVMKARCSEDRDYSCYLTAQTMQQMTGRVCRSETDRGETIITDDNAQWMVSRYRQHFNRWWLDSYHSLRRYQNPMPLEKL